MPLYTDRKIYDPKLASILTLDQLKQLEASGLCVKSKHEIHWEIISRKECAHMLNIQVGTLDLWRREFMLDGLHYNQYSGRAVKYYRQPVYHWFVHRKRPDVHLDWLIRQARIQDIDISFSAASPRSIA